MSRITNKYLLNLVSRSFALSIPLIDKNKRVLVKIQYLLARILDTIEDSKLAKEDKSSLIDSFIHILMTEETDKLDKFKSVLIENIIEPHDIILIENIETPIKKFFSFDKKIQTISVSCLKEMGYGMMYYQDTEVKTFHDLNDYCYYVAGTIGIYLTDIVNTLDNLELNKDNALSFSRFLQKVNIIKDAKKDLYEGRFFWPKELFNNDYKVYFEDAEYKKEATYILNQMVLDALMEFQNTINYIISIDKKAQGYKNFALLISLMAFETLNLMKDNYCVFEDSDIKIPRKNTLALFAKIKSGFYTDAKLKELQSKNLPPDTV